MARKRTESEVEAMVAGGRWVSDFIAKFISGVEKRGGDLSTVHRLTTKEGEVTFNKMLDIVVGEKKVSSGIFKVIVDYSQSLTEMIAVGKYDWVNDDITEEHFPVPKPPAGLPVKAELNLELVHFNRCITSEEAIAELKKRGLRPATLPELLAFGAVYKKKQREFPIVALGSFWQIWGGHRHVPCLWLDSDERYLHLRWFEFDWYSHYRFLAVREV